MVTYYVTKLITMSLTMIGQFFDAISVHVASIEKSGDNGPSKSKCLKLF